MGYYLMVKEAVGLGVKYLCKCGDYKDPMTYRGSGVFWRKIINKHKCKIETTLIGFYDTTDELRAAGEYYSKLLNVVEDRSWANLMPEIGDGGPTVTGKKRCRNLVTGEEKFFDDIPEGWVRGIIRGPKSLNAIERTRAFHTGRKRSDQTKERMRSSTRRKRKTVPCPQCDVPFTIQNLKRHMENTCLKR